MHLFTVQQVGKGRENVITINQILAQNSIHIHSKTIYNLLIEKFTVQSSGEKEEEIVINQIIAHHTTVYISSAHPAVHTKVVEKECSNLHSKLQLPNGGWILHV